MQRIVYGGAKVSKTAEFSSEAMRTGRENNVLKVRTERKILPPLDSLLGKNIFQKRRRNTFAGAQKLKELILSNLL